MKLLLDTCSFLWMIAQPESLSNHAKKLIVDPNNEVYLSSVSTWEMGIKVGLGCLQMPQPLSRYIQEQRTRHGVTSLPLEELPTLQVARLPDLHRDPFDRMLVCQAVTHSMAIVTPDEAIAQYAVLVEW